METPPGDPTPPPSSELWGTFCAQITAESVGRFMHCVNVGTQGNASRMHILFQSGGGNVSDGICLYNFLRKCPMDVTLYNVGTVASIGVIIFLGAKRRVAQKHATFMIHRSTSFPIGSHAADKLEFTAKALRLDDDRMEAILKEHLKFSEARWSEFRHNAEFWFTAEDAVKDGIAIEIGEFSPPMGSTIFSVYPNG
jgi:ATP-dependent Clp protease, protease subunit